MRGAAIILGCLNLLGVPAALLLFPAIGTTATVALAFASVQAAVLWFCLADVLLEWRQDSRRRDALLERQAAALEELVRRAPPPPPEPPRSRAR